MEDFTHEAHLIYNQVDLGSLSEDYNPSGKYRTWEFRVLSFLLPPLFLL